MKSKLSAALAAAACVLALGVGAAKADTITTFDVLATLGPSTICPGCTLGGDIVINTTNGSIVSVDVTMTGQPIGLSQILQALVKGCFSQVRLAPSV